MKRAELDFSHHLTANSHLSDTKFANQDHPALKMYEGRYLSLAWIRREFCTHIGKPFSQDLCIHAFLVENRIDPICLYLLLFAYNISIDSRSDPVQSIGCLHMQWYNKMLMHIQLILQVHRHAGTYARGWLQFCTPFIYRLVLIQFHVHTFTFSLTPTGIETVLEEISLSYEEDSSNNEQYFVPTGW